MNRVRHCRVTIARAESALMYTMMDDALEKEGVNASLDR